MNLNTRHSYYEILELKTDAPQHEVTSAYERAKSTYSAENSAIYTIFSEQEAREFVSMIEEAYSVLGNRTLRTVYDQRVRMPHVSASDLTYQSLVTASKQKFSDIKVKAIKPKYDINEKFEAEIKATTEWSGKMLSKVREYKKISLEQMTEITKISSFYVNALEEMNHENLPAIVFVRGYVVQVARALNLDDKLVADSYMKLFKQKLS